MLQTKIKFEMLLQFILIFYSKQAGPVTSFIFSFIPKFLQVKIQACFS